MPIGDHQLKRKKFLLVALSVQKEENLFLKQKVKISGNLQGKISQNEFNVSKEFPRKFGWVEAERNEAQQNESIWKAIARHEL